MTDTETTSEVRYLDVEVDFESPHITLTRWAPTDQEQDGKQYIVALWSKDWSLRADDERNTPPEWATRPMNQRVIAPLPPNLMFSIAVRYGRGDIHSGYPIELPCPPYTYEVEGAQLKISAGGYTKSGSKADWKKVLEQMQGEVDDLPDGIDITGQPDIDYTIRATIDVQRSIDVADLLGGHDNFDGTYWVGDEDELIDAIEDAIENLEDEFDLSYDEWVVYDQSSPEAVGARRWASDAVVNG